MLCMYLSFVQLAASFVFRLDINLAGYRFEIDEDWDKTWFDIVDLDAVGAGDAMDD